MAQVRDAAASTATQAANYLSVRKDWLARRQEDILEPGLPIIDPHHHLWDRPNWRYLLDDLLEDTRSGHNLLATVFVEAHAFHKADGPDEMKVVGEVEFVNGICAMTASGHYGKTRVAGIVGTADLALGSRVEPVLEALERAGGGRFKGIRHITAWDDDPQVRNPAFTRGARQMYDPKFREGLGVLARRGHTYDAWLYHPQIGDVADLADAVPQAKIVLNHCGGQVGINSYKRDEVFPQWKASIEELAKRPNVYVKLGGQGMRICGFGFDKQPEPPSSQTLADAWRPYMETCIAAFGAKRAMFESNFPVDKGSYSYPVFWNAAKILAKGASAEEKSELFMGTAKRVYRLDEIN
jgi:predicted TIM-barrel fold metal-dependent hydrolase